MLSRQRVEESEARFRSLIEEAPVAFCLLVGRDLRIEVANEQILTIWGKGDAVLGKPVAEALPELQGQPFLQILDEVYTTGRPYQATADRCDLVVDGKLQTFYFNFTYKSLLNAEGQVYAVWSMAVDVTEQVLARQRLEESEERYRLLTVDLEQQVQQRTKELALANQQLTESNTLLVWLPTRTSRRLPT